MSAQIEHGTAKERSIPVAPFITEIVGDVGRPTGNVPLTRDLGHLPGESGLWAGLANVLAMQRRGSAHFRDQVRRYGPVYRHALAADPIVFVADPAMIGAIARNEDRAWSAALAYRTLFGGQDTSSDTLDSPVGLDFEPHREARRLLQPAFSSTALAGYLDTAVAMFHRCVDEWLARGGVAFKPAIRELFTRVSSAIFMGPRDPAETALLDRALKAVWEAPLALIKHPLGPKWRRGMRGYSVLRKSLRAQVEERRAGSGKDLFSRMCQVGRDHVEWLDDDALVRLFIGVMAGALETTSLGLTSMAHLLGTHPEWQDRIREERRLLGDGPLSYEDVKHLEQTEWCWKETLRIYPVALMFPRRTLREVELGGYLIPAGTQVMCLTVHALTDPAWWTDPDQFDPERFSPSRAEDARNRNAYLPFGAGAHTCIGMQLANVEAKSFWCTLLSKCRIRLASNDPVRHEARPFGTVSGPVQLLLEPL